MNGKFDRQKMTYFPLSVRENKVSIQETSIDPHSYTRNIPSALQEKTSIIAQQILEANKRNASVICAFGAHTIKNGAGRLLGMMAEKGWITHLATNGAAVIHDWEFAFQGASSEDVRLNVAKGMFGTWEETGLYINLALAVGSYEGLGYGSSIGSFIACGGLEIPSRKGLLSLLENGEEDLTLSERSSAADLLELLTYLDIPSGFLSVSHPFAEYSAQCIAFSQGIPFTSHPMFGHDIIYTHKANRGAIVGRTAERDFLSFVGSVSNLEGGVYLSIGSAVMSPMIFEKGLSMARNVSIPQGNAITNCQINVVDLQQETWDWSKGEPPMDNPAYYLRFMKTFNRMGCPVSYTCADNRDFLVSLYNELEKRS
ncbi:MAG TPA: hypothetical protein DCG32_02785 [Sphaerochaeta sp.]|nr:hypothetical protein [Sphaerochaeta sp.]